MGKAQDYIQKHFQKTQADKSKANQFNIISKAGQIAQTVNFSKITREHNPKVALRSLRIGQIAAKAQNRKGALRHSTSKANSGYKASQHHTNIGKDTTKTSRNFVWGLGQHYARIGDCPSKMSSASGLRPGIRNRGRLPTVPLGDPLALVHATNNYKWTNRAKQGTISSSEQV